MVGSTSKQMCLRAEHHHPVVGSTLQNTTSTWGLLCCAVAQIGRTSITVSIPVLATITDEDLPVAEMLVTTLAQSLVTQTGFNIVEGGGQGDGVDVSDIEQVDVFDIEQSRQYVWGEVPWLHDNCVAAVTRARQKVAIMKGIEELEHGFEEAEALRNDMKVTEAKIQSLQVDLVAFHEKARLIKKDLDVCFA